LANRPAAIRDLADFEESLNILIYGDSGVGKTVLAGTAPDALFLSTEKGTVSAKRQGSKAKVWRIKEWSDLEEAFVYLRDEEHGFKWVILDSVTKMQQQLIRDTLDKRVEKRGDSDPDIPEIADHQKFQNKFKRFITAFIELPVNVVFTATAMRKEDEEGEDLVLPNIDGKGYAIANYACAEMDIVAYYAVRVDKTTKRTVRRLLCQSTPPYFAKDRYDALGKVVDDPTMPKIIEMIEGSGAEEKTGAAKTAKPKAASKPAATAKTKKSDPDDDFDLDDDSDIDLDEE
jgi:phage nucleotide-binding protein